ncbi:MAG: hypothetical protein PUA95_02230 [Lactimicrobium massiliense]|nr:hypothetical protein [Lactimicrobium massiliense]MDD6229532.1 hypothetical protein [Lactimicrobium massiliense]
MDTIDDETLETSFSSDELNIIDYLHGLVKTTLDPECPIEIYKTKEKTPEEIAVFKAQHKTSPAPRMSFKLDQSLSKPRWFWIEFLKRSYKIHVVLGKKDIENNELIKNCLKDQNYTIKGVECTISTDPNNDILIKTLEEVGPVLLARFDFLYKHRLVERCCCGLENACTKAHKCLSEDREMAMKCFWRKHLDDGSAYVPYQGGNR